MVKKITPLIGILILGLALRLININQSLWLDEAAQAIMSSKSIEFILSERGGDFHPPLFYLIAHYWQLLGSSDAWLRILPISFGVLTIIVFYSLADILYPNKVIKIKNIKIEINNLASFLLAIAPFHVYYSQEYRAYSLLCLLATVSMYFLLKKKYLFLSITNVLLLYTHYSLVFFLATQFIYVILYSRPHLKMWLLSCGLTIVLYAPWFPHFFLQLRNGLTIDSSLPGWRDMLSLSPLKATPLVLFKLIAGRITIMPKWIYALYILIVLISAMAAMLLSKTKSHLLYIWVFVPLILMIIASFIAPQTQPFRLIYLLPALIFFFIEGMFKSPKTFLAIFLYISIFGNLLYFTRPRLQREQWRQAGEFLAAHDRQILVKFPAPFAPLLWYQPNLNYLSVRPNFSISELAGEVYLLNYLSPLTDPDNLVEAQLDSANFSTKKTHNFEGVGFITEYTQ